MYGSCQDERRHKTKDERDVVVHSWWLGEKDEQGIVKSILESNVTITERRDWKKRPSGCLGHPYAVYNITKGLSILAIQS